jgi:pSer/pThr/pTyr-binding forkhead associated (FHA) protein
MSSSPESSSTGALDPSLCTRCGHLNPERGRFCSQCGSPLLSGPAAPSAVEATATFAFNAAEVEAAATQTGALVVSPRTADLSSAATLTADGGPNEGSRFVLDGEVTVAGRAQDSEIFLDDVTVSRRHAELVRSGQAAFLVRDLGSLNGTYVNRERVEQQLLADGDEVQIGRYRLVFHEPRLALFNGITPADQDADTDRDAGLDADVTADLDPDLDAPARA